MNMRKIILGVIVGISITMLISAGMENYVINKNTANVEMYQNVRIFTDSRPLAEYEYLGTVKITISFSGQYTPLRNSFIKAAKKKYPDCEGIILNFVNGGTDTADVIKFK
jgi:predicted small secreted protein